MKVQPLNDRIVVEPIEADEKTVGADLLPDTAKETPQQGKVLSVGAGKLLDSGKLEVVRIKQGDRVLYDKYAGSEVIVDGKSMRIMTEDDILAVAVPAESKTLDRHIQNGLPGNASQAVADTLMEGGRYLEEATTLDRHIEIASEIADGKPRIAGRDITVEDIVFWRQGMGKSEAEIAAENNLTLADVHAALVYYFDHQTEMDKLLEDRSPSAETPVPARRNLLDYFLGGVGSVLEFFPSPDRFDAWRLGPDTALDEWPTTIRGQLAGLHEDTPK